eukprot:scaffold2459_cov430-Prasinococcus_capsulatus_cf.AAC.3
MLRAARSVGKRLAVLQQQPLHNLAPRAAYSSAAEAPPAPETIEVFVNDEPVNVAKGATVLQACDASGVDIPRFCYHQRLSIAGNCRMCLVEVEKGPPKPVASCAMPAMPGMRIKTNSEMAKKAREGVMEFLLMNHPLDCPICDQGGECDLQDQSLHFGSDRGRFTETKRSVEDKNVGPLVKMVMTRCIHCTRCVRFATEVAGVQDLGVTGRGRDSEIGTYVEKLMESELSGNVVDLCPVGALTSKPYAFTARSWELKTTESIDVLDALGASINIDTRGTEVMRITPRLNEDVNEEWIGDKSRFAYDALKRQRLAKPMMKIEGKLQEVSWMDALNAIQEKFETTQGSAIKAIAGRLADAESMIVLKDLLNNLGSDNTAFEGELGSSVNADIRSAYLLNTGIANVEDADAILLVGTNPRYEAPLLNLRIRRAAAAGAPVASVGPALDVNYDCEELGTGLDVLAKLAAGKHPFASTLAQASRPVILVSYESLKRPDGASILNALNQIVAKADAVGDDWNGFSVLHECAARVAALDIGFVPGVQTAPAKLVYLLGADDTVEGEIPDDAFVIYQGHHGDRGAQRADIVLPGAAYTEKAATYVNTEGRVQRTMAAAPTKGDAREDWVIVRAIAEVLGVRLPYTTTEGVKERLMQMSPSFGGDDSRPESSLGVDLVSGGDLSGLSKEPLKHAIKNFYMTDSISRASATMAKCVAVRNARAPARAAMTAEERAKLQKLLNSARKDRIKESATQMKL